MRRCRIWGIACGFAAGLLVNASSVDATEAANARTRPRDWSAFMTWGIAQLVPGPLVAMGSDAAAFGLRWQLTPLVYSFGVEDQPWRSFLVSPVARHTGAIELYVSPEWICCARPRESEWLGRIGARMYFPVIGHGEALSTSVGGSYYYENRRHGGAAELGIYGFWSMLGATITVSPRLSRREVIFALALRLF